MHLFSSLDDVDYADRARAVPSRLLPWKLTEWGEINERINEEALRGRLFCDKTVCLIEHSPVWKRTQAISKVFMSFKR